MPREDDAELPGHVESLGGAVVSSTLDGVLTSWNPAAQRLLGFTASDAIGREVSLIVPPDRVERARAVLARVADGTSFVQQEVVVRTKDGRLVDVVMSVSPIHDRDGSVIGASAMLEDVRERRVIDDARARLVAIVDWSDDAIVSKTLEGIVTSWNRSAERLFGYTAEEAVGRSITLIIPPERLGEETEVLSRIRRGDIVDHFETVRRRKDGTLLDISLTVSPIRDARGVIVGASKIARDITQRKQIERERSMLLEQAQRASSAKDEFIAMLGHELRNPLSAITSAVHLLDISEGDAEIDQRARGVVRRQTAHLTRMVDDLLDVGRMITGKIILDRRPVDLAELVLAQLDTLRGTGRLDAHRVSVQVESVWVDADVVRVEQIIANLVGNAVRYTPDGGAIRVTTRSEGREAVLAVEDDGIGFDPALASALFELFRQGHGGLDRSQGGLGIGLTLVRRLAELHGGRVEAESRGPGTGSRFTVRLPLAQPASSREPSTVPPARSPHPLRVLAVEDNEDAREMLATLLSTLGHEVRTAADGEEGLAVAERWNPELVLLDIGLPRLDGFELCRRIRARLGAAVYLVALTGYGAPDDVRRAQEAGFDEHVTKPTRADDLVELGARARERHLARR